MTVSAVERCIGLIEALTGAVEPVSLSELADRAGLPASAAHRILTTLSERGWVVQDPASQNYALSLRLSTLAFRNLDARLAPDIVQTALDGLAARTREYCRFAVLEGENLIWVARAQGATAGLRYDPDMGQEIVLHATANGKAWLAALEENEALRIACARGLDRPADFGPNCVRTVDELRAHLNETRRRGYALAVDEAEIGTAAIAVAFRAGEGPDAPVAGTISVAGPRLRIGPERYETLAAELARTAEQISAMWPLRRRQRHRRPFAASLADPVAGAAS
ncbi:MULTISPECIES: IclR family transcriptional regulator [unclassified Roseitalea]|uniref:IclR family transcriptional regulator n=1 Tax=unclassified Roseitalea TaxID=2639107 RepID=UPI00273F59CC|nr:MULTISPECIES: IclR family transcriptional regulator [unclassified Roseitalea]